MAPSLASFSSLLALLFIAGVIFSLPSRDTDDQDYLDFFRAGDGNTRAPVKCRPSVPCSNHSDCGGSSGRVGSPRCVGALVGKCNCGACISGLLCKDDAKCGGLNGSCNAKTNICNCLQAAQNNYNSNPLAKQQYPTLGHAISDFCTKQDCSAGCLGLPCTKGICVCK